MQTIARTGVSDRADNGDRTRASHDVVMRVSAPPSARSTLVDNAKAIGIVLVVIGHAPAVAPRLTDFIFAFHMPLFFFLSGLLVGPGQLGRSVASRAAGLARTLLAPYAFYFLISYFYWLTAKRHGLRASEFEALAWWQPVIGFLQGTGDALYVNVALWFFPCLFVVALLHHVVRKFVSATTSVALFVSVGWAFVVLRPEGWLRWPWSMDSALVALAFYGCGSGVHQRSWTPERFPAAGSRAVIGIVAAFACYGLTQSMGHVDINRLMFGSMPILYLPLAILGIIAALALASLLPHGRLASWLSKNTLVIFPLHLLMFSVFTGVAIRVFGLDPAFKESSSLVGVLYVALALVLSVPAASALRTFCPWLFASQAPGQGVYRHPKAHKAIDLR